MTILTEKLLNMIEGALAEIPQKREETCEYFKNIYLFKKSI